MSSTRAAFRRHMLRVTSSVCYLCPQGVIHELNKNCDVMKLVTNSLVKCHKQAVVAAGETSQLSPNTLVDGRYTHSDVSYMLLSSVQI